MNDNNFDEKYRQQQFNSYLDIMQQSLDKLKKRTGNNGKKRT